MSLRYTSPPLPPMPLCRRCGVIAPTQAGACPICAEAFPSPRPTVRPDRQIAWVAVRCSFQCRSCHFLSPLDDLDIDGSVECAQCGQSQRFDVDAWHEALALAHGVGDLAYPLPEGRLSHPQIWIGDDNPYLAIGNTAVFAEHRQSSSQVVDGLTIHRSLFIEAAPGVPVCEGCREILQIAFDRDGLVAACPGCGSQARYRLPAGAERFCEFVVGVVAEGQRVDQRRVRMTSTAEGPIALECPECGAALANARERMLTCQYCGTTSLIPAQARVREVGQVLTPDIWWLAFRGPSKQRAQLEQPPASKAEDEPEGKIALTAKLTSLELADEKPGHYPPQLLLNLAMPTGALLLGYLIYWLLSPFITAL